MIPSSWMEHEKANEKKDLSWRTKRYLASFKKQGNLDSLKTLNWHARVSKTLKILLPEILLHKIVLWCDKISLKSLVLSISHKRRLALLI